MILNKLICFAAILANVTLSYASFYHFMCPSGWSTNMTNCWEQFNKTDYCSARSVCGFYRSKISTSQTAISSGASSELWLLDSNMENSALDNTCPSISCPFLTENKLTSLHSCNSSKNYICENEISTSALGMQNGYINDFQLSSSSFFQTATEPIGYNAIFSRFGNVFTPGTATQGGWCSNSTSLTEYLQIDFKKVVLVTKIETQGVKGRDCDFWTTQFYITHRGLSGSWRNYKSNYSNESISGNSNADDVKIVNFDNPVFASKIRFHPTAYGSSCNNVAGRFCFRLEAYGIDTTLSTAIKLNNDERNIDKYSHTKIYNSHFHKDEISWPIGNYSLPKPESGCPSPLDVTWKHGYRLQNYKTLAKSSESNTSKTSSNHLRNTISTNYFVEEFCSSVSSDSQSFSNGGLISSNGGQFPEGDYCIYKLGANCPQGFQTGSLKFFEDKETSNRTWSHTSGIAPETSYIYNQSDTNCCYTEMHYCCRNDGASTNLTLPAGMPFYLIPIANACPNITDTSTSMEYVELPLGTGEYTLSDVTNGVHPFIFLSVIQNGTSKATILRYHLCYYEPTETAVNQFVMIWKEERANADYELGIKLALYSGKSLIRYGIDSDLKIDVTVSGNCSLLPTMAYFNMSNGVGIYNGGISVGKGCGNQNNATVTFSALTYSGKHINISKHVIIVKKANILVFISKENFNRMPELNSEIQSLVREQSMQRTHLNINVTIIAYEGASDVRYLFRGITNKANSDPDNVHGIVAINTPDVRDILYSVANTNKIPLITANTKPENLRLRSENSLQFTIMANHTFSKTFQELKYRNISEIVLIRSKNQRIPLSLAYYVMTYNIKIDRDIEIASSDSVENDLKYLKSRKFVVYFIVDTTIAKILLITATRLRVSPINGYTWISGSTSGVYDDAVGAKECYRLKPTTCSEAFRGTIVFQGVGNAASINAYISDSMNHQNLQNISSQVHISLNKNMIMNGVESILKAIIGLKVLNKSINAEKITEVISKNDLSRLKNLQLSSIAGQSKANKFADVCAYGWSGDNCTQATCTAHQCQTTNGKCVANGICECHSGYFGSGCYGNCADRCQYGICNNGRYGDGTCEKCDWLYGGIYCDKAIVLKALIASCLGSLFVAVIGTCYVLRICRPRQHVTIDSEKDESTWILDWKSFTDLEKVNIDKAVAARHLSEKIHHTEYFRTNLHDKTVFVKCMKKNPVKLSLDVRLEIRKIVQLDHINIEKLIGVCLGPPYVAIVTELANTGSLYDTLHAENVDVSLEIKYTFMEDICRAMVYLHDKCRIAHGRLKSTNCLLHKGWRVKITDIGLTALRKRANNDISSKSQNNESGPKQGSQFADYNSLLWTAPEYLGSGISNLDQIENVQLGGDVYSFGILMAEILSRASPYEEIKVMSTQHIIEAIAHLREPLVDLEVIRPGANKAKRDMLMKPAANILRPKIKEDVLPKDEPAKSILRLLMESAWSDDPGDRPSFAHIKNVLKIIVPLKGDQMAKRAFLLEKETEMLEKYIAHDTKMILKEREKIDDWFNRLLPPDISQRYITGEDIQPKVYANISVAVFQIVDFQHLVNKSQPNQLISLLDYLFKMFYATASNQKFNISEFGLLSGTNVIVSANGPSAENQVEQLVKFCLKILRISKKMVINYKQGFKLNLKAAMHCGKAVGGLVMDYGKSPRYRIFGDSVKLAIQVANKSESNCLLITEECARLLQRKTKIRLVEATHVFINAFRNQRTYWVPSQNEKSWKN